VGFLTAGADLQGGRQSFDESAAVWAHQDQPFGSPGIAINQQFVEECSLGFFSGSDMEGLQTVEVMTVREQRAFGDLPLTIC